MRGIYLLIFAVSGFSGLIYESIWSHYLKLFLGHAAYAQTLVLAIFMGGMAVGAWLCGRYSARWRHLIRGYAAVEAAIGLAALAFHSVFQGAAGFAFAHVIPALGSPGAAAVFKWALAALLILPQSILLGMTFPLMTAGLLRRFPANPGATISMLYFTNSIGGALGVLASGFVMIRLLGLPGTIACAGAINIGLAVLVWLLAGPAPEAAAGGQPRSDAAAAPGAFSRIMLAAAFATGLASFIYEIGWIRMLTLVLGSSTHAFELMLSAFILGLAAGGLWIRRRIDHLGDPVRWLAAIQVLMGLAALATLAVYNQTFDAMRWLLETLPKTDAGYRWYSAGSHGIALAIMLPATFCAGTTLPLITYALLRAGHGERSIGAVYAANTVGAIVGVVVALHLALPALGLKGLIALGAAVDMGLGVALLWHGARAAGWRLAAAGTVLAAAGLAGSLAWLNLDPYKMASGVYRLGELLSVVKADIVAEYHGKTATVHVTRHEGDLLALRTNGKVDASRNMAGGKPRQDEATMTLLGALPLLLNPGARTAANIGFGSGISTQLLLSTKQLERVDTVEIEPAMIEAARAFRPFNELAYTDPRSRLHIEDAKTFFSTAPGRYDIIVSEPSNPWVSGVAGLFSEEFFRLAASRLSDSGVLVQWLQIYEIDMDLVVSVLKALAPSFRHYAIYAASDADVIIVARNDAPVAAPDAALFQVPAFAGALARVGIRAPQDIELRKVATGALLAPLLSVYRMRANSDYYPVLDQGAERARYFSRTARSLSDLGADLVPVLDMLGARERPRETPDVAPDDFYPESLETYAAVLFRDALRAGTLSSLVQRAGATSPEAAKLLAGIATTCATPGGDKTAAMLQLAVRIANHLQPAETALVWQWLRTQRCGTDLSQAESEWLELLQATAARDARRMADLGDRMLASKRTLPREGLHYLVAATMLGHLANGEKEPVRRLWQQYSRRLFPGNQQPTALFLVLAAHGYTR